MPGLLVMSWLALLALWASWRIGSGNAGPDPAKWLLHESGFWALVLLCATLSISTLRRFSGRPALMRWRRPLGLAGFAVASAHLLVYLTVFHGLDWPAIVDDLTRRSYIIIGATAWLLLVPMALTSTRAARRRLGERWTRLHRVFYLLLPLAVLHQGLAQKADLGQTLVFSAVVACFLIERVRARRGASRKAEKA
ncbi:MAG TPA: protein-methionine-sulfoxide reductase heme-binding subunit MsrQ [Porticoccaceae bacterium]